jgi:hypothetical protein
VSPLWRDEIAMYVSPHRVAMARMRRGMRPVSIAELGIPVDRQPADQVDAALRVLEGCLGDPAWQHANARLIVSDHWTRYAIVPWSDELTGHSERLQYARICLSRTYGDVVSSWDVTLNEAPPGAAQVACAIPRVLLTRIQAILDSRDLRLVSVQPQLIAAFNSWRASLPRGGAWFVTLEEGSIAAAHFEAGGWDCVRSVRIRSDWETELKRLQLFGQLAQSAPKGGPVYVDAPKWLREQSTGQLATVEWLDDAGTAAAHFAEFPLLRRVYS